MDLTLETTTNNVKNEDDLFKSLAGFEQNINLDKILESTFADFKNEQTTQNEPQNTMQNEESKNEQPQNEQATQNEPQNTTQNEESKNEEQLVQVKQIKEQVENLMQEIFSKISITEETSKEKTDNSLPNIENMFNMINMMNKINPEEKEQMKNNLFKQMPDLNNLMSSFLGNMNDNEDDLTDFLSKTDNTETESYDETDDETDDETSNKIDDKTKTENNSNMFMSGLSNLFNFNFINNLMKPTKNEENLTKTEPETEPEPETEAEETHKQNNEKVQTLNEMMSSFTNLLNISKKED